jgi:translation initiation factor IF-3
MIRISPVRVIGPEGEQLGVLPVEEALAAAQERGLDLVEVAPTARPPVVKIMDYGPGSTTTTSSSRPGTPASSWATATRSRSP